ncbi:MAG TPA: glycine zipper 2TM domain-containing protein [Burkholderiales bacterium]|nr:glycine zipper 2TM domain-containing protein [Burkholderiales bacterium]
MKPTKLTMAAVLGASLVAAAPAFADPGYGRHDDDWREHGHDRRVVVTHERPRYVERRVVVVERPAVVYRAAPAYAPYPAPNLGAIGGAIVGAAIGSQFGGGNGKLVSVAAGSVLGAFVGDRLVNGY